MPKFFNIFICALCLITMVALSQNKQLKNNNADTVTAPPATNPIIIAQEYTVHNLDPAIATDTGSARVIANIFEGLVRFESGTTKIEPCLATSWSVSDNATAWTFQLRQNVRFHDGTVFDSSAVKFSVERQFKNQSQTTNTYADFVYAPLNKVEIIDPYTIKFHLKYPYSPFLNNLAMPMAAPIVSPTAVHKYGDNFSAHPVGTGPFTWVGNNNSQTSLRANKDYWGTSPAIDEILFLTLPQTKKRVEKLLDNSIDIALDLTFEQTAKLRFKGYPVLRTTGLDISYLGFYTDKKPFNQPSLRKAVLLALNRKDTFNKLWPQEVCPASSPFPPAVLGYNDNLTQEEYDPNRATRLLKAAGYDKGISFTLITYTNSRPYTPGGGKVLADALAHSLSQHGIEVTVKAYPWDQFKQALNRHEGEAFIYGWISDNGDPDNFLYTLLSQNQIKNGLNTTRYHNPELETLLISGRSTIDQEIRQELYNRAQEILIHDTPWIILSHSLHYAATSHYIRGLIISPTNWPNLHGLTTNSIP